MGETTFSVPIFQYQVPFVVPLFSHQVFSKIPSSFFVRFRARTSTTKHFSQGKGKYAINLIQVGLLLTGTNGIIFPIWYASLVLRSEAKPSIDPMSMGKLSLTRYY